MTRCTSGGDDVRRAEARGFLADKPVTWTRIQASKGELFALIATPGMERDLQERGVHITETRTMRRLALFVCTQLSGFDQRSILHGRARWKRVHSALC